MTPALKAAVVLLVTLPVLAYVGGTLSAAPPDRGPRTPVILQGPPIPRTVAAAVATSPSQGNEQDDDGGVRVVNPSPTRVGEDDGDRDDEPDPEGDDGTDDDTTAAGTTERAAARRLAQVSVRTRLTVVIALLTLVAMTGAGVLVWTLESARIDAGVSEQIDQEIDEFRVFEREGVDPQTGAPLHRRAAAGDGLPGAQRPRRRRDARRPTRGTSRAAARRTGTARASSTTRSTWTPSGRCSPTAARARSTTRRTARSGSPPFPCGARPPTGRW